MGDVDLPSESCVECEQLWQEFADATNIHLRTLGQLQIAVIRQDQAAQAALRQAVAESAVRRQTARNAFKIHAATHDTANQEAEL